MNSGIWYNYCIIIFYLLLLATSKLLLYIYTSLSSGKLLFHSRHPAYFKNKGHHTIFCDAIGCQSTYITSCTVKPKKHSLRFQTRSPVRQHTSLDVSLGTHKYRFLAPRAQSSPNLASFRWLRPSVHFH